jgi:tetratricopeptide (TPR) repeat protein
MNTMANKMKLRSMKKAIILTLSMFTLSALSQSLYSQEIEYPEEFATPIPLMEEILGDFHFPISSDSALAQAFFDQGMQMMYAFAKLESARSFREAQIADPNCAICFWGEAWSWGSYLNGAMTTAEAPRALAALNKALALIDNASDKEVDLIRSLQSRYIENYDPATRRVQDQAYADTMAELARKYPDDLNIATFYADALFLLEERRGYRRLEDPNVIRLHGVLESVLERDITHPGACHLYVHATESTPTPELAAPCAELLGTSIPGASHINHMPSHTWNEMGLWEKAVRANTIAWHSDQKSAIGRGVAIYPTHNLTMLYYAAAMGGASASSIQAAKDLAKLNGNSAMHAMSLVRFGRYEEALELDNEPSGDVNRSMYSFSQAYSALKQGNTARARETLAELLDLTETTTARFRFHDGKNIIGALAGILEGQLEWDAGNLEGAAEAFRRATRYYDSLNYDEPEPLPFSPRHWLGAAYIALGAYDSALVEYELDMDDHPNNVWSLHGAATALEYLGRDTTEVNKALQSAMEFADVWLLDSRL